MTRTSYTITVTKAANGWIVNERDDDPILVPEGESLGDAIAAAIASDALDTDKKRAEAQQAAYEQQLKNHTARMMSNQYITSPPVSNGTVTTTTTAVGDGRSVFDKMLGFK